MRGSALIPLDAEAMERLLAEHGGDATGMVLLLAWRQGLTRDEISSLTWEQVDLEERVLRLKDREVPLEEETAEALYAWREQYEKFSPYVAVSGKFRRRMAPQSLSNLARLALDGAGLPGVRLQDLRRDYIQRQFRSHDWPHVLRVAGISVTTYRNSLARLQTEELPPPPPEPRDAVGEEFRLWRVMQSERETPAGIALWLSTQTGLRVEEIAALTWDMADLDAGVLHLPGRDAALTQTARSVLAEERARRGPEDDPHVILTPRTRKPMSAARLTTVVRTALIRGGIEGRSLSELRRDSTGDAERAALLDCAERQGSVSRAEAAELLQVTEGMAYRRLLALCEDGALVRINTRYYPADRAVRPERQREAVCAYIAERGSARRQDVAELLHIGERQTGRLLRRMVEAGELVLLRRSKRYMLPERAAADEAG